MNKKIIFVIVAVGIAYMVYGFLSQIFKDEEFKSGCEQNANQSTTLVFVLPERTGLDKLTLKLKNGAGKPVKKVMTEDPKTKEFRYTDGFSIHDTLELVTPEKQYEIYGFEYSAITINEKKGLECAYNGAYIDGKWNDSNVFMLK
ncbi:hypothetical protein [Pedobacter agri]|uniref:Uncharacterized protein n=1 Tax=Pedobacter agri TaxID=454586 RepID=A0A9X3IAJ4_9SPHI|nr:hypothetical protein [Pedobacter agri]MCX3266967.1 hypothetical protein [Pedobacter agri]